MITKINESKILTKYISSECKFKFDVRNCNSNQKWNIDKCRCECKNPEEHNACEKHYISNPGTCSCENGEYLVSSISDSVITCDEIANAADSVSTGQQMLWVLDQQIFMDCIRFLLVVILQYLIAIICYHDTKHRSKQKNIGALII